MSQHNTLRLHRKLDMGDSSSIPIISSTPLKQNSFELEENDLANTANDEEKKDEKEQVAEPTSEKDPSKDGIDKEQVTEPTSEKDPSKGNVLKFRKAQNEKLEEIHHVKISQPTQTDEEKEKIRSKNIELYRQEREKWRVRINFVGFGGNTDQTIEAPFPGKGISLADYIMLQLKIPLNMIVSTSLCERASGEIRKTITGNLRSVCAERILCCSPRIMASADVTMDPFEPSGEIEVECYTWDLYITLAEEKFSIYMDAIECGVDYESLCRERSPIIPVNILGGTGVVSPPCITIAMLRNGDLVPIRPQQERTTEFYERYKISQIETIFLGYMRPFTVTFQQEVEEVENKETPDPVPRRRVVRVDGCVDDQDDEQLNKKRLNYNDPDHTSWLLAKNLVYDIPAHLALILGYRKLGPNQFAIVYAGFYDRGIRKRSALQKNNIVMSNSAAAVISSSAANGKQINRACRIIEQYGMTPLMFNSESYQAKNMFAREILFPQQQVSTVEQ